MPHPKKILVCPLDWGLGHATRCIPIMRSLMMRGVEVYVASSGLALDLLRLEFPSNVFFELPSYDPQYANGNSLVGKMLQQLPKFRKVVATEHGLIREINRKHQVDVIISDNRYGCWVPGVESILITHQLKVLLPEGFGWASPGVNWILHQHIKNFDRVWIPDQPGSHLIDPFFANVVASQQYIGWLSRFELTKNIKPGYSIVAIISGPEPQRTLFEKKIRRELTNLKTKSLIVLGRPGPVTKKEEENITVVNHLSTPDLQQAIQDAGIVVSRSGYSTIMDLIALKKNAIFIPTPGQPEQMILANYLDRQRYTLARSQKDFDLAEALEASSTYRGMGAFDMDKSYLAKALDSIV